MKIAVQSSTSKMWMARCEPRVALLAALVLALALIGQLKLAAADDRKTTSELIRSRGFDVAEFEVISQNYVLKVYRIINPLADPKQMQKTPVLACHGVTFDMTNMMASSKRARPRKPVLDERITLYAMENGTDDQNLHFYLANNNYDVWLLESRATNDRVMHRLPLKNEARASKSFWDFSLDEQALIDLPLQIDFVLQKTNAKKGAYISYSQSTTLMFALLSMRPEYSEKLLCFIAMAPVVYTSHVRGASWPVLTSKLLLLPSAAVPAMPHWYRKLQNFWSTYMCSVSFVKSTLCRSAWQLFSGRQKADNLEGSLIENVIKSTSMKAFEQFGQNAINHDFRMYDYKDELRNLEEYGQTVPPAYNISKINLRTIVLFRGTADFLSDPVDQMFLLNRLRVPLYEDHILEDYSHIDFLLSPSVTRDINEPVLRILDTLTKRPVKRIRHTLGKPNPQVEGTQLELPAEPGEKVRGSHIVYNSQAKAERPSDGVQNVAHPTSTLEQVLS